jgi:hypothetical protein
LLLLLVGFMAGQTMTPAAFGIGFFIFERPRKDAPRRNT